MAIFLEPLPQPSLCHLPIPLALLLSVLTLEGFGFYKKNTLTSLTIYIDFINWLVKDSFKSRIHREQPFKREILEENGDC